MQNLIRAKSPLVLSQPFFGCIALKLKFQPDPTIKTMAVDGVTLAYNPTFIDKLTLPELIGVLAHEVMHVACLHHTRRCGRDPKRWNRACDYAINGELVRAKFELPKGGLLDAKYDGMSAEAIYRDLDQASKDGNGEPVDQKQNDGNGSGNSDPGGCGEVRDAPGQNGGEATPDEMAKAEADAKMAVAQATRVAAAAKKLPGGIDRLAKAANAPLHDWREEMHRFAKTLARSDYAWTTPNRRYVSHGLYLPSIRSEEIGPLVIAIDVSGSISQVVLNTFAAEVNGIRAELNPSEIVVIYCDNKIRAVERFDRDSDPIELRAMGGGGTNFVPPFDWVDAKELDPAGLIYLTDLLCCTFPKRPEFPVLWASTAWTKAPFGDVVKLDL